MVAVFGSFISYRVTLALSFICSDGIRIDEYLPKYFAEFFNISLSETSFVSLNILPWN